MLRLVSPPSLLRSHSWYQFLFRMSSHNISYIWLVVWLPVLACSQKYWVSHHPNWRTPSFFRGVLPRPTNQCLFVTCLLHHEKPWPWCLTRGSATAVHGASSTLTSPASLSAPRRKNVRMIHPVENGPYHIENGGKSNKAWNWANNKGRLTGKSWWLSQQKL